VFSVQQLHKGQKLAQSQVSDPNSRPSKAPIVGQFLCKS